MPKMPMDYSKTIIYKIVCNDLSVTELYVGHTTNWKQRKSSHNQSIKNINHKRYNCKKSTFIREHGGWINWTMIEIEIYPCNNEQEARARERYWYEELNAKLNSRCPIRSKKEYYEENKDEILKKHKEYNDEHKEHLCEKIKEYYEKNKEHIIELQKEYYEQNKEKIKARKATKYECDCGATIRQDSKIKHFKTLKHCEFIQNNI